MTSHEGGGGAGMQIDVAMVQLSHAFVGFRITACVCFPFIYHYCFDPLLDSTVHILSPEYCFVHVHSLVSAKMSRRD